MYTMFINGEGLGSDMKIFVDFSRKFSIAIWNTALILLGIKDAHNTSRKFFYISV